MFDDFVSKDTAPLYQAETGNKVMIDLLWGDGVQVIQRNPSRTKVRSRGRQRIGWVENAALGGKSLLELYFIDVGQGDGILIKTPNFRHVMIDGGYARAQQDTGKNAADFVDWKFYNDYALDEIHLDAMLASHCDADHYGGLWDLLNSSLIDELNAKTVRVNSFYHAGIAWWKGGSSGRTLGPTVKKGSDKFFTRLMGDRPAVEAAITGGADPQLQGSWSDFMQTVVLTQQTDGSPTFIQRLSSLSGSLPGFGPGTPGEPSIQVLAPFEHSINGMPALRCLTGGDAQNTNGSSLLLRLDFDHVRVLLTGDLNRKAQRALLTDYAGQLQEFECDITKGCHHGSDDVSFDFLKAMCPAVTVISSGDNEGHDHPRPATVAASAVSGFQQTADDELVSPLIYSTELARSVGFGHPYKIVEHNPDNTTAELAGDAFQRATIHYKVTKPGDLKPSDKSRRLGQSLVVANLIYGLVNVRTDGHRILCATLNEKDYSWNIKTLQSRF